MTAESNALTCDRCSASNGSRIAEDFAPSAKCLEWAAQYHSRVDVKSETELFTDYHLAKGTVNVNWQAAWRYWIARASKFQRANEPEKQPPSLWDLPPVRLTPQEMTEYAPRPGKYNVGRWQLDQEVVSPEASDGPQSAHNLPDGQTRTEGHESAPAPIFGAEEGIPDDGR